MVSRVGQVREKVKEFAEEADYPDPQALWFAVKPEFDRSLSVEENVERLKEEAKEIIEEEEGEEAIEEEKTSPEVAGMPEEKRKVYATLSEEIAFNLSKADKALDIEAKLGMAEPDWEEAGDFVEKAEVAAERAREEGLPPGSKYWRDLRRMIGRLSESIGIHDRGGYMKKMRTDVNPKLAEIREKVRAEDPLGKSRTAGEVGESPEEKYTWKEAQEYIPELEEHPPREEYRGKKYTLEKWRDYLEEAKEEFEEAEEIVESELEESSKRGESSSPEEGELSEEARELERSLPGYAEVTEEDDTIIITAKRGVETTKLPRSVLEAIGDFQDKYNYALESLISISRGADKFTAQEIVLKPE